MRFNPILDELRTYPFVRLDEAKARARATGIELIDFGVGEPHEITPSFIRTALMDAVVEMSPYPRAGGLQELRTAISAWLERRFGVALDAGGQIVPTLGTKEAIFALAHLVVNRTTDDLVVVTSPGYPVPERGARFAGAGVVALPLGPENDFLPDLDAVEESVWERAALVWVNYPNNPTGAVAPLTFYERLAALAREHDFVLASDEPYSEIYFDEPPPSALQVADLTNVVVFNSLSKRSAMAGYRSGFMAGDEEIVEAARRFRPSAGLTPQEFVQKASAAAWEDDEHVDEMRALYRAKRAVMLPALADCGLEVAGSRATFFLWVRVPRDVSSEDFAGRFLNHGVVIAPGSYLGREGEGYVRFALVPALDECERAAKILRAIL